MEQDEEVARALEIAERAAPNSVVRVVVYLEGPDYSASSELVIELLLQNDAVPMPLERTDIMAAEVTVALIPEILCWPRVVAVTVTNNFWEVVEPPWDTSALGTEECPIVDGTCPEHCLPVPGYLIDEERNCVWLSVIAACSVDEYPRAAGSQCRVRAETEAVYVFHEIAPRDPSYVGWQECSEEVAGWAMGSWPVCQSLA